MRSPEDGEATDPAEKAVLADRLRWAAESLTMEFQVSPADAERLIFDVAADFLSGAKVAQFVPTLAIRRARQLLRDRQPTGALPLDPDLEVILDVPLEVEIPDPVATTLAAAEQVCGPTSGPPRSPAEYAAEAKRLLERAKVLRATALLPAGPPPRRSRT